MKDFLMKLGAILSLSFLVYMVGYQKGRDNGEKWFAATNNGTDFKCIVDIQELRDDREQISILAKQLVKEIEINSILSNYLWECKLEDIK